MKGIFMSKTIAEVSAELIEANKTVKPIQEAFNEKVRIAFDTIKKFHRSHKAYNSKYDWVEDLGFFTLHADDITKDGIYFEYMSYGGGLEEASITFEELDNIEAHLEADHSESVAARAESDERAQVIELRKLEARIAELKGE